MASREGQRQRGRPFVRPALLDHEDGSPETRTAEAREETPRRQSGSGVSSASALLARALIRPPILRPPLSLSYLMTVNAGAPVDVDREHFGWLCYSAGASPPEPEAFSHRIDFDGRQVYWWHDDGASHYLVIVRAPVEDAFAAAAVTALPEDWLSGLAGELSARFDLFFEESSGPERSPAALARLFGHEDYGGAKVAGGYGLLWFDTHGPADGPRPKGAASGRPPTRFLLRDQGMSGREAGRLVLSLVETERHLAMAARAERRTPQIERLIAEADNQIRAIAAIAAPAEGEEEVGWQPAYLHRLINEQATERLSLHRAVERLSAAAAAIDRLREQRLPGLSPMGEEAAIAVERRTRGFLDLAHRLEESGARVERQAAIAALGGQERQAALTETALSFSARSLQLANRQVRLGLLTAILGGAAAFTGLAVLVLSVLSDIGLIGPLWARLGGLAAVPVALIAAWLTAVAVTNPRGKGQR